MYLGSGDTNKLLLGIDTIGYTNLLQRFVSNKKPLYNSYASPIDALRIGKILEDKYFEILEDDYYAQYEVICNEMNVFKATLDFAKINNGSVVIFDELKTCNYNDFIDYIEPFRYSQYDDYISFLKKNFKDNYNQVQQQLLCTGLNEANLVFLVVYSYDDEENMNRTIKDNEYIKFKIKRDNEVIDNIKKRGEIFQIIKDYHEINR